MKIHGEAQGRVLEDLHNHGGRAPAPKAGDAQAVTEAAEASKQDDTLVPAEPTRDELFFDGTTRFDFAFTELTEDEQAHLPVADPAATTQALLALGAAMVEQTPPPADQDSPIPAIYTYWGQFLDHDLTANTDREMGASIISSPVIRPLPPKQVALEVRNLRFPALNLDAVYGDGPTFTGQPRTDAASFYRGVKFAIGEVTPVPFGVPIPPDDDLRRDLPRVANAAQIADGRNDENLVIAQLHLAFLRFHNAVVDWVTAHEPSDAPEKVFRRARQLVEWHYQWLVVNDYLRTVARRAVVDAVLAAPDPRFAPREGEVFMPLEFSVAAFRFGHSMVRGGYDYNRNFGAPGLAQSPFASLTQLFQFTGGGTGGLGGNGPTFARSGGRLPGNWVIEWDRFTDKGATVATRFARKIDTHLAPTLLALPNAGNDVDPSLPADERARIGGLLKHLAQRNLLRGYLLSLPTGEAVADALGVPRLAADELADPNSRIAEILAADGLPGRTPLWYYLLREAQVREGGRHLGEVGSRVVAQTIVGQVRYDPTSYLQQEQEWTPAQGVRLPDGRPITSIPDFLRFAGVMA